MRLLQLTAYPCAAVGSFLVLSRATTGHWLVTDGFFEIDETLYHNAVGAVGAIVHGVRELNGPVIAALAAATLLILLVAIHRRADRSPLLVVLGLAAGAALPLYAFWDGNPFRIRYMVELTMALAAAIGLGIGVCRKGERSLLLW